MSPNISSTKFLSKIKLPVFFFVTSLIFFLAIYFTYNFFLIKKIEIISDAEFSLANKNKFIDKNLLLINKEEVAKIIIRENYFLKNALVEKVWPNTLKITISIYEPCVSLVVNIGYFNLSCDGRILKKTKEIQQYLPTINYYQKLNNTSFQTGDWIDYKDINQALFFIEKIKEINMTPLTIDIKGQDMLVFNLIDERKIIFSIDKDRETQDYQLELIIRQFKAEGKGFKKIDLRFNKPIVQL